MLKKIILSLLFLLLFIFQTVYIFGQTSFSQGVSEVGPCVTDDDCSTGICENGKNFKELELVDDIIKLDDESKIIKRKIEDAQMQVNANSAQIPLRGILSRIPPPFPLRVFPPKQFQPG